MIKVIKGNLLWLLPVLGLAIFLGYGVMGGPEEYFMPGETSHGHHQIEMACSVCHTEKGKGVKQDACTQCHQEELTRIDDSHPVIKFKDPRNAPRLENIEATKCITCHREHQPEITGDMGVTLPTDYCYYCHQEIASQRPSHEGMGFDTCATAGCHNFHDNSALYERFMSDHLDEPNFRDIALVKARSLYSKSDDAVTALKETDADMPQNVDYSGSILHDWSTTAHAAVGVNCTDCHNVKDADTGVITWEDRPSHESCQKCHEHETKGFLEGKHGMRLAHGLSPMTPGMAKIPMREDAAHRELTCASCHTSHKFDTQKAAVDACLQCHNDEHTLAYKGSLHFQTFRKEMEGHAPENSGVSCATCHMPRVQRTIFGEEITIVDHNQNNSLRPNEKMIRSSCIQCHGLQFTIDALADEELIKRNFQGRPSVHVDSLEMVREEKIKAEARAKALKADSGE